MPNLRILKYDYAPTVASISSSTQATGFLDDHIITKFKNQTYRSTATSAQLTLIWTTAIDISMVGLAFTNLTSSATMRVRGYATAGAGSPSFDSGTTACAEGGNLGLFRGTNTYSYGGGVYAESWFTGDTVEKIIIDVTDSTNPDGYIEIGRLVTGDYYEVSVNPNYGGSTTVTDATTNVRNEAGDLLSELKYQAKTIQLSFGLMPPADREVMYSIFNSNGKNKAIYMSLFPKDSDAKKSQMYRILGKQKEDLTVSQQYFNRETSGIVLEEV